MEYAKALIDQNRWTGEGARERWRRREGRGEEAKREEWKRFGIKIFIREKRNTVSHRNYIGIILG